MATLAQNGVKVIETKDQPLDTDYHEAIAVIPAPSEEQKGNDSGLRTDGLHAE